jgi:chromosome segregation ATPase
MSGTANPSAHQQVRRAVVDEIKELKNNVSELQESIAKLEELDSSNKRLHTKVTRLESELKDIKSTHQNLLDFKTQATKLLTALVSSRGVDEVRNQILSSALASDDPNAYLKALVDVDPEEGNGRTEAAQSANDGPRTAGQGVSMPQNEAEILQEELRDSQELKVSVRLLNTMCHTY